MLRNFRQRLSIDRYCYCLSSVAISCTLSIKPVQAQVARSAQVKNPTPSVLAQITTPEQIERPNIRPLDPREIQPPSTQPLPEPPPPAPEPEPPFRLPPPEQLLPPETTPTTPETTPGEVPQTINVKEFKVTGSTVFSQKEFAEVLKDYINRPITLAELFQARAAITELYVKKGYITSGAYIPTQKLQDGVVEIRVVEGSLEDIKVTGTRRLRTGYVRSRLAIATKKPLNRDRLLQALQLLQLNPLIDNLSAELSAGSRPGVSLLEVRVKEADTFDVQFVLDNGRSPAVGSFRRQIQVSEANLFGFGDSISAIYTNTDGSNAFDFGYTFPINARNGTISFNFGISDSNVIERPFNDLDIQSNSRYYELTLRQPIIQTPTRELAVGLTATRRESEASLNPDDLGEIPFPAFGANDEGETKVTALRFFQEWTQRSSQQVFAVRSQFSVGLDAFDSDSFLAWRGQAQWVRLLAPDTLFLLRGDLQVADRPLVPFEQFGLGGIESVRGYRQDALLTDDGFFASAEVRIPIARFSRRGSVLQVTPFFDIGTVWNRSGRPSPDAELEESTLASVGFGLRLQLEDWLTARIDWGIPLISISGEKDSWQENGLYFSIIANPF
jgi:hemolysin activation/secretion protein